MVGAFLSILLLMVARHHPPSRRKIKQIWHGRVYWESNTTMLRSSPGVREKINEQTTDLGKYQSDIPESVNATPTSNIDEPSKVIVTPPAQKAGSEIVLRFDNQRDLDADVCLHGVTGSRWRTANRLTMIFHSIPTVGALGLDSAWSTLYSEWFEPHRNVKLNFAGVCKTKLKPLDAFYSGKNKFRFNKVDWPRLKFRKSLHEKALDILSSFDGPVATVHGRWLEGSCVDRATALNNFCTHKKENWQETCHYTGASISKLIPSHIKHILYMSDNQKPEYAKTFKLNDIHPFRVQVAMMVESDYHFGNPMSSIDYVVSKMRENKPTYPEQCFAEKKVPSVQNIPNSIKDSTRGKYKSDIREQIIPETINEYIHMTNVAFDHDTLHIYAPSERVKHSLRGIKTLPQYKRFSGGKLFSDLPTPKIVIHDEYLDIKDCENSLMRREHAYFYSPWHTDNMFHLHNDNILPLVDNILNTPGCDGLKCDLAKTLYQFEGDNKRLQKEVQMIRVLRNDLFDTVKSWKDVFRSNKKVCIASVSWGRGPGFFYIDLPWYVNGPNLKYWTQNADMEYESRKGRMQIRARAAVDAVHRLYDVYQNTSEETDPKVNAIYVERSGTRNVKNPELIMEACVEMGWNCQRCCDWQSTTYKDTIKLFSTANVVIGPHGAGLAHVLYTRRTPSLIDLGAPADWRSQFTAMAYANNGGAYIRLPTNSWPMTVTKGQILNAFNQIQRESGLTSVDESTQIKAPTGIRIQTKTPHAEIKRLSSYHMGCKWTQHERPFTVDRCSSGSTGNMLAQIYMIKLANFDAEYVSTCLDPESVQYYIGSDRPSENTVCEHCTSGYPHTCASGLDLAIPLIQTDMRYLASEWRRQNLRETLEETVIHVRCGDILHHAHHTEYGFSPYWVYKKYIPRNVRSIGILSATLDGSQCRKKDCIHIATCRALLQDLQAYLVQEYPGTVVTIRTEESVVAAYARMVLAKVSVCNPSTFCVFPTIASLGQGVVVGTPLYPWVPSNFVSKTPFLNMDAIVNGRMQDKDILEWLRVDADTQPLKTDNERIYNYKCTPPLRPPTQKWPKSNLWVSHFTQPRDIMLDVGCNTGQTSFEVASHGFRVVCFEPIPKSVDELCWNQNNRNLNSSLFRIIPAAVSKEVTYASFTMVEGREDNSAFGTHATFNLDRGKIPYHGTQVVKVPVTTIDATIHALNLDVREISLMKIDVQGFEADVIEGAQLFLSTPVLHPNLVIVTEYQISMIKKNGLDPSQLFQQMKKFGFVASTHKDKFAREHYVHRWNDPRARGFPDLFWFRNNIVNPSKVIVTPPAQKAGTKPMIAICAATHSKSTWRSLDDTALQKLLLPSIERTISTSDRSKYDFRLYLAADHDDHFWLKYQNDLETPDWLSVHIGFYEVPEHKIPFNPMMRTAFDDGAEYMVRINDDSEFVTSDWVSKAVAKLASYDPSNVGMVGPNCREGNRAIMTHDMVHRTHLDIFEHYYPDAFSAWWIDDWISKVYGPQRSTKMMDWTVKHHTHKHGTRYKVQGHEKQLLKGELEKGGEKIEKWLKKVQLHKAVDDAIINPESEQQPENSEPPHLKTNNYIGISAFINNINPKLCSHAKILKGTSKLEPDVRICMPELPCVVYSFGIANNWLFDDMMLDHGCSVWSFDPSMKIGKHSRRPTHLFEPIGIGATSGTHKGASTLYGGKNHYMVMTLEDLMKKYGHTHIDIVRMDTETAEWDVLAQWNRDNTWSQFDQLLMEIHLMRPASNSYNSKALTDPEVSTYTNILQHIPFKLFHSAQNKDPSAMVNLYNGLTRVYEVGLIKTKPVNLETKPSLIISGVARDVYAHQDSVLKTIREQQNHFNIIKIVVYENDSKDDTLKGLHTWQDKLRIPVDIISEKKIGGNRVERISRGRNAILVALDKISSPPDFLLIMDLDSVNANLKGVQTCLDMEQPWGACCANQRDIYYDLWALRTFDDWCDCDVWNDAECAKTREAKFRHISADNGPIEVKSCFGGAALYNYTRLKTLVKQGARYDSDTCEHVSFHKHLRKQDGQFRLFIQPKMLNDGEEKHVPLSVRTRLEIKKKPREKLTIERTRDAFKIIILTQRRHWSLKRLLNSLNAANYAGHNVHIEIRVDKHDSEDHRKTLETARAFKFEHGTVDVHENTHTRGLQYAWFDAWTPRSETERAIIIEDDLEVSPLWFTWLQQAWTTYGSRDDLGSISICKQPLRASDGRQIDKQVDAPFMYRMIGSWGFSPNARFWKPFIEWVRNVDLKNTDVYVPGCITSAYHKSNPDSWEQFYIWWCNKYSLYAMYVHPRDGALVAHWGEPGVHYSGQPKRNVNLIRQTEPALENFPAELVHYGWDFEPEKEN